LYINKMSVQVSQILDTLTLNLDASDPSHAVRLSQMTALQTTLQAAIDAEETRATAQEATLDARISSEVAALVNGAPETLDTLNELATALGNDSNLSVTITNLIAAEETRALAAEAAEQARALAAEAANALAVTDETTRAQAAEAVNAAAVSTEQARAVLWQLKRLML
jgi:hypothetical protein